MSEKVDRNKKVRLLGKVIVLTPSEFDRLKEQATQYTNRFQLDLMLNTGMRYTELRRFVDCINNDKKKLFYPERNTIELTKQETKTNKPRNILLTPKFSVQLQTHIDSRKDIKNKEKIIPLPRVDTMTSNLIKWRKKANIEDPVAVRTLRKTWESWLVMSDKNMLKILSSMGHTSSTALAHYIDLPKLKPELPEILKRTEGWG